MKGKITELNKKKIYKIIKEKKESIESPLIAILSEIQSTFGYIDEEVQEMIAQELDMSKSRLNFT